MFPDSLVELWSKPVRGLGQRLYVPLRDDARDPTSLAAALAALADSTQPPWPGLVPITYVDDRSLACVVCQVVDQPQPPNCGHVVRWHLDDIPIRYQAGTLDIDVRKYVDSLQIDLDDALFKKGYEGMAKVATDYQKDFVGPGKTPKAKDLRPFQLACQNVIIGLAAMRYNQAIDGLAVQYWQTCEVPHVATNEGSRALVALMLCDAFQSGGTMEIDFSKHPEGRVPSALRRYGRAIGVDVGVEVDDGVSISPTEARRLFLAVTPMPDGLRECAQMAIEMGVVSAERLCYSLLSPVWPAIELEFILRCSSRASSILVGGADPEDRSARLAELEVARAATMIGTLFRRLDSKDSAGGSEDPGATRVFEDSSHGVQWHVLDDYGAVEFHNLPQGALPWQASGSSSPPVAARDGRLVVLPRPHPLAEDSDAVEALQSTGLVAMVVPRDAAHSAVGDLRLLCPERLSEIDARVERNLETSRLIRA